MSFVAVLPSIHPPYTDKCVAGMSAELAAGLVLVDNTVGNRGLAASWNIGARRVLDDGADWLVIISAGTRFGPAGGVDLLGFLASIDPADVWVVESAAPVNQHLMAWSRPMLEGVGLVDENFFPIYGEDADFSRRVHVAQAEGWGGRWVNEPVDAWLAMVGHATKIGGVTYDWPRKVRYYTAKWGGWSGAETYARPFNDPDLPLSYWPRPPDPRAVPHEGWGVGG